MHEQQDSFHREETEERDACEDRARRHNVDLQLHPVGKEGGRGARRDDRACGKKWIYAVSGEIAVWRRYGGGALLQRRQFGEQLLLVS